MSYQTREIIICDRCRIDLLEKIVIDFGMPTLAHFERLTQAAVDAGWLHVPPDTTPEKGEKVHYTRHFCPACRANVGLPPQISINVIRPPSPGRDNQK